MQRGSHGLTEEHTTDARVTDREVIGDGAFVRPRDESAEGLDGHGVEGATGFRARCAASSLDATRAFCVHT